MVLICPIMMLFMHRGDKNHDQGHHNHLNEMQISDDYKVKQLEGEIEFLKRQNKLLQKKVNNTNQK